MASPSSSSHCSDTSAASSTARTVNSSRQQTTTNQEEQARHRSGMQRHREGERALRPEAKRTPDGERQGLELRFHGSWQRPAFPAPFRDNSSHFGSRAGGWKKEKQGVEAVQAQPLFNRPAKRSSRTPTTRLWRAGRVEQVCKPSRGAHASYPPGRRSLLASSLHVHGIHSLNQNAPNMFGADRDILRLLLLNYMGC